MLFCSNNNRRWLVGGTAMIMLILLVLSELGHSFSPLATVGSKPPITAVSYTYSHGSQQNLRPSVLFAVDKDQDEKEDGIMARMITPRAKSASQWTRGKLDKIRDTVTPRAKNAGQWIRNHVPFNKPETVINGDAPPLTVIEEEKEDDKKVVVVAQLSRAENNSTDVLSSKVERASSWVRTKAEQFRQQPAPVQAAIVLATVSVPSAAAWLLVGNRVPKKALFKLASLTLATATGTWVGRTVRRRRNESSEDDDDTTEKLVESITKDRPPQLVRSSTSEMEETEPKMEAKVETPPAVKIEEEVVVVKEEPVAAAQSTEQDRQFVKRVLDRVQDVEMPSRQQQVVRRLKDRVANVVEKLPHKQSASSSKSPASSSALYLQDLSGLQQNNNTVRNRLSSLKEKVWSPSSASSMSNTAATSTTSYLERLSSPKPVSKPSWFASTPSTPEPVKSGSYLDSIQQGAWAVAAPMTPTATETVAEIIVEEPKAAPVEEPKATPKPAVVPSSAKAAPTPVAQASSSSDEVHVVSREKIRSKPSPSTGRSFHRGGLSSRIKKARQQPKPEAEEQALRDKYASIPDLEERAFHVLKDLGMIEPTKTNQD